MRTGTTPILEPMTPNEPTPDQELMQEVRDGELVRLGELFERHHARLYQFFLRLGRGDRALAEDLVQEVFVRILKYRHTFRSDAEFTPWLFKLARNAATDLWRSRPKELAHEPDAPEPAASTTHPLDALQHDEHRRRLARALDSLSPEKRELLLLARFSELDYDEIGELLGATVGAIKVRVHRAMKDLKAAFDALEAGAVPPTKEST